MQEMLQDYFILQYFLIFGVVSVLFFNVRAVRGARLTCGRAGGAWRGVWGGREYMYAFDYKMPWRDSCGLWGRGQFRIFCGDRGGGV